MSVMTESSPPHGAVEWIEVAADPSGSGVDFVTASVEWVGKHIQSVLKQKGTCVLGLSGGSTPAPIYQKLAELTGLDWKQVFVFLVDERHVLSSHRDSNMNMLGRTLFASGHIPQENIFSPDTSLPVAETIRDYSAKLRGLFEKVGGPDIVTLGLGPDGHLASLFPPVDPAGLQDADVALCLHTTTDTFATRDRISVTLPVLVRSQHQVFFLRGADKLAVWQDMVQELSNGADPVRWPGHSLISSGKCSVVIETPAKITEESNL